MIYTFYKHQWKIVRDAKNNNNEKGFKQTVYMYIIVYKDSFE